MSKVSKFVKFLMNIVIALIPCLAVTLVFLNFFEIKEEYRGKSFFGFEIQAKEDVLQIETESEVEDNSEDLTQTEVETETETEIKNEIPFEIDLTDWKYEVVSRDKPKKEKIEVELAETYDHFLVDKRIKEPLEEMILAAREEGLDIIICSAHRTADKQWNLIKNSVQNFKNHGDSTREAYWKTLKEINQPGESEHETGLAVDLVGRSHQLLNYAQSRTPDAKWLKENCARFGFILRYPEGKEDITKISFESWHFRYVGVEVAEYIMEKEITLEEFLMLYEE